MAKKDMFVKRDTAVRNRTFNYSKGACKLNFVLRTDIKQELKDFLECLKVAAQDVQAELDTK